MIYWKQLNNFPAEENRNPKLFYYMLQDQPGRSYLICKNAFYNIIGYICTTAEILGDKDYITDVQFGELGVQEDNNLHEIISYILK